MDKTRIIDIIDTYESMMEDNREVPESFSYDQDILSLKLQLADLVYDLYTSFDAMSDYDVENTLMEQFGFLYSSKEESESTDLEEHIEAVEDERNLYLKWFEMRGIDVPTVTREARSGEMTDFLWAKVTVEGGIVVWEESNINGLSFKVENRDAEDYDG